MNEYTVILLYPDYLAQDYGADIFCATVHADDADRAIATAEIRASTACEHAAPPEDFKAIAVILGCAVFVPFDLPADDAAPVVLTADRLDPVIRNEIEEDIKL